MTTTFEEDFGIAPEPREKPADDVTIAGRAPERAGCIIREPGVHFDVTPDQYFAEPCPAPAVTNSGIQLLAPVGAAPAKFAYHHPAIGQPPEERASTAAQYRGSLVHRLALDKGDEYVLSPHDAYRSAEAKAWRDGVIASGRVPVKEAEMDTAQQMADRIRPRIVEACQGEHYETEVVIAWQETVALTAKVSVDVWCRAMLDVWCPALMLGLDVKTCRSADDDAITKAFANGYAIQDAWYSRGINALTADKGRSKFGFLFVESEPPYLSREVAATEGFRHGARMMIDRALWLFARGLHHGEWPGYEPLRPVPTPWFLKQCEEAAVSD